MRSSAKLVNSEYCFRPEALRGVDSGVDLRLSELRSFCLKCHQNYQKLPIKASLQPGPHHAHISRAVSSSLFEQHCSPLKHRLFHTACRDPPLALVAKQLSPGCLGKSITGSPDWKMKEQNASMVHCLPSCLQEVWWEGLFSLTTAINSFSSADSALNSVKRKVWETHLI